VRQCGAQSFSRLHSEWIKQEASFVSQIVGAVKPCIKLYDEKQEYFFAEGCFITELSNSGDDPDVSIARARLEPGKTTRWHFLRGTSERYVVQQGQGSVEIGDLSAQRVTAGDVVVIPPEVRQRISNVGTDDLVFLAICSPRFTVEAYVDIE
jgi:mannose-6-phosphate isomerase-like protein (cupin superfamily)